MTTRSWVPAVLLVAATVGSGCGKDGDKGTNPNGGQTSAGAQEFGNAIQNLERDYFDANGPAYASLGFFAPFVASTLGGGAPLPTRAASGGAVTCIDPGAAGETFEWNGSDYVVGGATGAPANGARFTLYQLDGSGQPITANPIGHLDVTCDVITETRKQVSLTVVISGQTILMVAGELNQGGLNTVGFVAPPQGSPQVTTRISSQLGGSFGDHHLATGFELNAGDLAVGIGTGDSLSVSKRRIIAGVVNGVQTQIRWVVQYFLDGSLPSEQILGGAVIHQADEFADQDVVACVNGGTLSQPVYGPADASCRDRYWTGGGLGSVSSADLAVFDAGYKRLLRFHEALRTLAVAALGLPGPND